MGYVCSHVSAGIKSLMVGLSDKEYCKTIGMCIDVLLPSQQHSKTVYVDNKITLLLELYNHTVLHAVVIFKSMSDTKLVSTNQN